jgi:amino acid adenylation domain-containing protein
LKGGLYQVFAETAERYPDAPAIEFHDSTVTYRELRRGAEAVAEQIREAHGAVTRVGVFASRGLVAYASYLAALRLGAAVVPLNPGYPPSRNKGICDAAGIDVVVADAATGRPGGPDFAEGRPVLPLTGPDVQAAAPSGRLAPYQARPDGLAYVLFTSGTTGRPKGIPIRNRHVVPFLARNVARYRVGPGCRMSHTFELTFDLSVFDLFVTWSGGATLVVPTGSELFSPVDYMAGRKLTHWFSVPSAVSVSAGLGQLATGRRTALRHSLFCGEQFTRDQAELWHAVAPGCVIDNLYGPTELTVACAEYRLPEDPRRWPRTSNGTVPIGHLYEGLDYMITEDTGELRVRGPQRFDGYLDPRDDEERFVDGYFCTGDRVRVEAGQLVHLGRRDDQVKVRGFRVEPSEVEAALRRLPHVEEAVVIAIREDGVTDLVACYTGRSASRLSFIRALRETLPIHQVPRRYLRMDSLPRNANGKIDRNAVRIMAREVNDDALT